MDLQGLDATLAEFGVRRGAAPAESRKDVDAEEIARHVHEAVDKPRDKEAAIGGDHAHAGHIMPTLDQNWKEHSSMDYLRQGIHLALRAEAASRNTRRSTSVQRNAGEGEARSRHPAGAHPHRGRIAAMEAQERAQARAAAPGAVPHADSGGYGADEEAAQPDYQQG